MPPFLLKEEKDMNYIIFDLEWNQPTDDLSTVVDPIYFPGDIIEIGAAKLDEHFQLVDTLRVYSKPKFYPKMHKRIASLTGIHDKLLEEQGLPFPEAYAKFIDWCGDEYTFMTWSMSDLPTLIDNMVAYGVDISDLPDWYDLQRIFGREIMRSTVKYSLEYAMEVLNETGGDAHDAMNDSVNTAKICDHLDLESYLDEYASRVFAEAPGSHSYESTQAALQDASLLRFPCPWCGDTVSCEPWIHSWKQDYVSYGKDEAGDEFYVTLTVSHLPDGSCRCKRIFQEMSDDLWEQYQDRKALLGV